MGMRWCVGQRLSIHLNSFDITKPASTANTKKHTIIITVPYMVDLNASKPFAFSVMPALPFAMPVTTESRTMPITSSIIAAEIIVVPSLVLILPSSFKTETVMATLVAVSMVPIKIPRKSLVWSEKPRPILPKGRDIKNPSKSGTATPEVAIKTAASPVLLSSFKLVSSPVENISNSTPIFAKISSAFSLGRDSREMYPPSSKPIKQKPPPNHL